MRSEYLRSDSRLIKNKATGLTATPGPSMSLMNTGLPVTVEERTLVELKLDM